MQHESELTSIAIQRKVCVPCLLNLFYEENIWVKLRNTASKHIIHIFLHFRFHNFIMGLTKQYLRYLPDSVFGVVGSQRANILYLTWEGQKLCAVAACEHVFIWDLRNGERVRCLFF